MHVYKNKGVPFTQQYNFITKPLCSSIEGFGDFAVTGILHVKQFWLVTLQSNSIFWYQKSIHWQKLFETIKKSIHITILNNLRYTICQVFKHFPYTHTIRNALFSLVHMAINNNLVHIKTMRGAFWQTMPHNNQESFCYEDCYY